MARYRAAIDAGGDVGEIRQWINEAKADRLQAEAVSRHEGSKPCAGLSDSAVRPGLAAAEMGRDADRPFSADFRT